MAALCEVLQGQYSSLETEIVALEKGILLAKEMALTQVIFESDALTMVQEILSKESNGSLGHLYQGIEDLLKSLRCWKLCHPRREHNRVAHELAHHARYSAVSQVWKGCSPPMVRHLIQMELYLVCWLFLSCSGAVFFAFVVSVSLIQKKKKKKGPLLKD